MKKISNDTVLEVNNLSVEIDTPAGVVHAVRGVSFELKAGEVLAIVGESGCGKSMLCKSIMQLLPRSGRIAGGSVKAYPGAGEVELTDLSERELRSLRGSLFSMVFQDPMSALDPTMSIGAQIAEAVTEHRRKMPRADVYKRVIELMRLVGIDRPEERYKLYPHNFSGGMRQRSVFAMALASNPKILIADEPTTSLDVTIQAQIIDLLREIQEKLGTATILISHDLGVVARAADRVAVMYAGKIVEVGTAEDIYYDPRHPYTVGLLKSLPSMAMRRYKESLAAEGEREVCSRETREKPPLYTIPGMPPSLINPPKGDAFASRNPNALPIDFEEMPPMFKISETHFAAVRSWRLAQSIL